MKKKKIIIVLILLVILIVPFKANAASDFNQSKHLIILKQKNFGDHLNILKNTKNTKSTKTAKSTKKTTTASTLKFCESTASIWQIVGWVFLIVKIVIPILLIIFGMIDFSKCVVAGKDDEIKKSMKSLAFRAISGVVIFFIPTIVSIVMGLISNFSESGAEADYLNCKTCILDPKNCNTSKDVGKQ